MIFQVATDDNLLFRLSIAGPRASVGANLPFFVLTKMFRLPGDCVDAHKISFFRVLDA